MFKHFQKFPIFFLIHFIKDYFRGYSLICFIYMLCFTFFIFIDALFNIFRIYYIKYEFDLKIH